MKRLQKCLWLGKVTYYYKFYGVGSIFQGLFLEMANIVPFFMKEGPMVFEHFCTIGLKLIFFFTTFSLFFIIFFIVLILISAAI